jgi:hypothetical protein
VDKATGERLAQVELPGSVRYGMMTYVHAGKQYLVVNVVGGNVALALP